MTPKQVRRFQRKVNATRRVFHYIPDKRLYGTREHWAFPPLEWRKINGLRRLVRVGDCEDGMLDAGRRFFGGKERFLTALDDGECAMWRVTTGGRNGRPNHAALEIDGHFAETIFWTATDRPTAPYKMDEDRHMIGSIYLVRKRSAQEVRAKLGMGAGHEYDIGGGP